MTQMVAAKVARLDVHGTSGMELMIRFVDFCDARPEADEIIADIVTHFRVHRSTAYRWYHAYCDARGIPTLDAKRRQA